MAMVEKRVLDTDLSASVSGLHSLPSAFAALLEGGSQKQVISLADVDDGHMIKVCTLTTRYVRVYSDCSSYRHDPRLLSSILERPTSSREVLVVWAVQLQSGWLATVLETSFWLPARSPRPANLVICFSSYRPTDAMLELRSAMWATHQLLSVSSLAFTLLSVESFTQH